MESDTPPHDALLRMKPNSVQRQRDCKTATRTAKDSLYDEKIRSLLYVGSADCSPWRGKGKVDFEEIVGSCVLVRLPTVRQNGRTVFVRADVYREGRCSKHSTQHSPQHNAEAGSLRVLSIAAVKIAHSRVHS